MENPLGFPNSDNNGTHEEVTGCSELRTVIGVLQTMTDDEWSDLLKRPFAKYNLNYKKEKDMIEKLKTEIKQAMYNKDTLRLRVLRTLLSDAQKIAISDRRKDIIENDLIGAVSVQIKRHIDSIEQFTKGNREDLVAIEKTELDIYKEFQPQQMSDEEVETIVDAVIVETGATIKKDMGRIIGRVKKEMPSGAYEMKKLSHMIMSKLN